MVCGVVNCIYFLQFEEHKLNNCIIIYYLDVIITFKELLDVLVYKKYNSVYDNREYCFGAVRRDLYQDSHAIDNWRDSHTNKLHRILGDISKRCINYTYDRIRKCVTHNIPRFPVTIAICNISGISAVCFSHGLLALNRDSNRRSDGTHPDADLPTAHSILWLRRP